MAQFTEQFETVVATQADIPGALEGLAFQRILGKPGAWVNAPDHHSIDRVDGGYRISGAVTFGYNDQV